MSDDPVVIRHRALEQIAMAALEVGRLLSETGGKTSVIAAGMKKIAEGLGAEQVHARVGYASLALTVSHGGNTITRMIEVGPHGVNMRLNQAVRELCIRVAAGGPAGAPVGDVVGGPTGDRAAEGAARVAEVRAELARLRAAAPHHPRALVAIAAGVACAAFGRLLGVDWAAVPAILVAATAGQWLRVSMLRRGINVFVLTAIVAFAAACLAGLAAGAAGSGMVQMAMTAAVLLLVPGVPAMNAQTDIMEGYPTMGSARFVTVGMILMFITLGLGAAQMVTPGIAAPAPGPGHGVLHQAVFGAVAAAGFGVLFNFSPRKLAWAAAAGALALAVRSVGLGLGWNLEASSFVAAAVVALAVELPRQGRFRIRRPRSVVAIAGCIPMIPGGAATNGIIGLLELTAQHPVDPTASLAATVSAGLRVVFTIGAIGAGLTMVRSLAPHSEFP